MIDKRWPSALLAPLIQVEDSLDARVSWVFEVDGVERHPRKGSALLQGVKLWNARGCLVFDRVLYGI